jgi:hypothetical protein
MPGQFDVGSPAGGAGAAPEPQHRPSRRRVLLGAAGAGVAGLAATGLAGTAPAVAAARRPMTAKARGTGAEAPDARAAEPIVVHLRDASTGEIDVFRGTSQVRLRDPDLAARLVRASR